jgi:hypothetical protein
MEVRLVGWVAAACSRALVQVAAAEAVSKVPEVVEAMAAVATTAVGREDSSEEARLAVAQAVGKLAVGWGWGSAAEVGPVRGWVRT